MTTESDQSSRRGVVWALAVMVIAATLASWVKGSPALADATFNSKMLELVNQQRAIAGLAPLQLSASLASVAEDGQYNGCGFAVRGRSMDMGVRNYFSHTILSCGTQGVFNMMGAAGIQYGGAGENIAWMNGTTDPLVAAQRLTNDLMASPGHKANILNGSFTHIGIGSWTSGSQSWSGGGSPLTRVWIATQVFATMTVTSAPSVGLSSSGLAFGNITVGVASAAQTATVTNTGNGPLTVSAASIGGANPGDFTLSNGCGTVQPGNSCSIAVTFKPSVAGARSATMTISDNAAGSPHMVALTGTGVAVVAPGPPTAVVVTSGNAAISATWTPPAVTTSVDGYGIYVFDANNQYTGNSTWVCSTCTSGTVTGVINGQWYHVAVFSHYALGWGGYAFSDNGVVVGLPSAPTGVVATKGNGQVNVSWTPPSSGSGIDMYALLAYDADGYTSIVSYPCGSCVSGSVWNLTNGRTYWIAVYAHTASGWSSPTFSNTVVPSA
jgi:uncharacterized protein YkwD